MLPTVHHLLGRFTPQWMKTSANMPINWCWMPTKKITTSSVRHLKGPVIYTKEPRMKWWQRAGIKMLSWLPIEDLCSLSAIWHHLSTLRCNSSKPARICCSTSLVNVSTVCPVTATVGSVIKWAVTLGISRTRCTCSKGHFTNKWRHHVSFTILVDIANHANLDGSLASIAAQAICHVPFNLVPSVVVASGKNSMGISCFKTR